MQVLIGTMNRHRAIDPFTYRPVTQDEIGIEPVYLIKDELKRSAQVVKARMLEDALAQKDQHRQERSRFKVRSAR
jgi:hypothetical protein